MPQFAYKAVQENGVLVEGSLDASNRQEALRQVEVRGLKPIRLAESGATSGRSGSAKASAAKGSAAKGTRAPFRGAVQEKTAANGNPSAAGAGKDAKSEDAKPMLGMKLGQSKKITPRQLENFTRLLSSLLAAGVPFSRALVILHREAASPAAKAKWKEILDIVIDGMSL